MCANTNLSLLAFLLNLRLRYLYLQLPKILTYQTCKRANVQPSYRSDQLATHHQICLYIPLDLVQDREELKVTPTCLPLSVSQTIQP